MKKITFIIGKMTGGGAERVISVISDLFVKTGYEVHLIIFRKSDVMYPINEKIICHYLSSSKNKLIRNLKLPFSLYKKMKEICSDVYISFCILENITACMSRLFFKTKLIISERNAPKHEKLSFHLKVFRKLLYGKADGYVFQTNEAMNCYPERIQKKSVVIPNPIIENLPRKTDYRATYRIVAVGRLAVQKNYPMLLKAFRELCEKSVNSYDLYIYGKGLLEPQLKKMSKIYGISSRVHFMGFVENVHDEICNADMYVMTSDYEGMPNALMESMAIGLPCISTDCPSGGPKMLIHNDENGILVPTGDADLFSKKMLLLSENAELCERYGVSAKQIRFKYDKNEIFKLWDNYIKSFLEQ